MGLVVCGGGWKYDLNMNRCERNMIPVCDRNGESRPMGLVVVGGGGWTYELDMNRCERNMIPVCVCVCVCVCVYARAMWEAW